jgi:prepilin-type N-terminal cleavage/methylation domain-containing protein
MQGKSGKNRQKGFTLIEFLVVMSLLVIVIGVALDGLIQMQRRSTVDASKLENTQETRQFMDQISNDIHQIGYPNSKLFDPAGGTSANSVSGGLISGTATTLQFEADVDGSGIVSEVYLQLVVAPNGVCCTLQRGTIPKSQVGSGAIPYYTEVDGVTNLNKNPTIPVFEYFDNTGTQVTPPLAVDDLPNIKTIRMTVDVQQKVAEVNGVIPTVTLVTEAKINN